MTPIRYFIYYRIMPTQVKVLALWHSSRAKDLDLETAQHIAATNPRVGVIQIRRSMFARIAAER